MKYEVLFQIYNKKLKVIVDVDNELEAMRVIRENIQWVKITPKEDKDTNDVEFLKDIFNIK